METTKIMLDKTTLGISDTFREFIEALVEEVVINGEPFDAQKKWLRRYSEAEGLNYETLENNLNDLFEASKELEEHESKSGERLIGLLAKGCYLSEALVNKLIDNAAAVRTQKEAERKAQEEKEQNAREEAERKAREERDRIAKEKAQLQKKHDAERKAREEEKRKTREEVERKAKEEAERKAKEELEKKRTTGELNGHEWVDLGLPSGTLWATCNVGADLPEDYGDYFAWGETQPKTKYSWISYKYGKVKRGLFAKSELLTKYCSDSDSGYDDFTDGLTVLQVNDDAATVNWGNGWQTPTEQQWVELKQNTINILTERNGIKGMEFFADNGNSLFLPAAGFRSEGWLSMVGESGNYWSNTLDLNYSLTACHIYFHDFNNDVAVSAEGRNIGLTVRPVYSM